MTAQSEQCQSGRLHAAEFLRRAETDPSFLEAYKKGVPIPILLGLPVVGELPVLPPRRRPMRGILEDLSLPTFDPTRSYIEYQIDGRVEQVHLIRLPHFPYEVSIIEVGDELVFRTEDSKSVLNDEEMRRRLKHTRCCIYNSYR